MVTASGIRVEPRGYMDGQWGESAPGITDIAQGLGRMCRYGGHTTQWWSVLQHSLACRNIALQIHKTNHLLHLYVLWHDAHEAVTADVPSHWKPNEMEELQEELDIRIRRQYGIPEPSEVDRIIIKMVDKVSLYAEAYLFGPPGILGYLPALNSDHAKWYGVALDAVSKIMKCTQYDDPRRPTEMRGYHEFVNLSHHLLGALQR